MHTWNGATRRSMVSGLAVLAVAMAFGAQARAQAAWPSRPLRLVLPFAAGSGTDIAARILAEELTRSLGQNVLVDNRPGASGQIAAEAVAKAPPDGYTLFLTTNTSHSANPHLFRKLSYDPVKDFSPVARTYLLPFMLVVDPKLPVRTVAELIAHARAAPAPISYGYGNSTGQVAGAALGTAAMVPLVAVPYKSTPPAMTDVIGGTVQFMFVDLAAGRENVRAGRLRAIAVTTTKRSALMPELPAVAETPGLESFDLTSWGGLFGPAGMPAEIVAPLSTEVIRILERKDVRERYAALGVEITTGGPDELARFVREQLDNWGRKIRDAGIRPE